MKRPRLEKIVDHLREQDLKIIFAESMTGGLTVSQFSCIEGVSDILLGCLVTYSPELKMQLLGVKKETLDKYTAESCETTREMVEGLLKISNADVAIAVTGLASPGGSETEEKPVGTVFVVISCKGKMYEFRELFMGDPDEIKQSTADYMFEKIEEVVSQEE